MSDLPQAPDWWQASDGKWYPPQEGAPSQDPFVQQQQQQGDPFAQQPAGVTFGAPAPPTGRGCANIGVIITILIVLMVGGIIAFSVFAVNEAEDAIDDSFGSDEDEIDDVEVTDCRRGESFDWGEATIEVTNDSSDPSTYFVTVTFESRNGQRQFGTGHATVTSLQPGRTTEAEVSSAVEVPRRLTCTVTSVQRISVG